MQITYSVVIKRALIAAVLAGICMAVYAFFVVEPTIDDAIDLEERTAQAAAPEGGHGDDEEPLFTRSQQVGGGVLATVLFAGGGVGRVRHRVRRGAPPDPRGLRLHGARSGSPPSPSGPPRCSRCSSIRRTHPRWAIPTP